MNNQDNITITFDDAAIYRLINGMNIEQESGKILFEALLRAEYKLSTTIAEKKLNFRKATLKKLMAIVNIEQIIDNNKFKEWFSYDYKFEKDDELFLENLIKANLISLRLYNEATLTVKFIGSILNRIDFSYKKKGIKDWYEYSINCRLNGHILSGRPDFMVATGIDSPESPYFFFQKYKPSVEPYSDPENQVLAAMLAAIALNKTNTIKGCYMVGQYWKFVILNKSDNDDYEYFVSKSFDCLDLDNLKSIYIILQSVKDEIINKLIV